MKTEIITIGDEILIGQIIDTNSVFLAKEFNKIGISIYQITSIQDDKTHILKALEEAEANADIIIITGGLGPTKDDITKHTLCTYFNDKCIQDKAVLDHIAYLFKTYIKRPASAINKSQALVPSKAIVLKNEYGTAPGMWFNRNGKVFVSLPGVPSEMKAIIKNEVIPRLKAQFKLPHIYHKTILTYGLGESAIANRIEHWENNLPKSIKLAYLPSLGRVRLRLSAKGIDKEIIQNIVTKEIKKILPKIHDIFVGYEDEDTIETIIAKQLILQNKTLATAESCTGGQIAQVITQHPGASQYFKGSIVAYATETKSKILNISEEKITKHSLVSQAVVKAMATNVKKLFGTDYALSTTGNAGPGKGDSDVDVGTVWIGIATPKTVYAKKFIFSNQRQKNIMKATNKAFELFLKEITHS